MHAKQTEIPVDLHGNVKVRIHCKPCKLLMFLRGIVDGAQILKNDGKHFILGTFLSLFKFSLIFGIDLTISWNEILPADSLAGFS